MPEDIKQGVTNGSETPSEQPVVDNNSIDTSSNTDYQQSSSGDAKSTTVKTYTEEEVNKILHARTKEYSEKIKQYEELLYKYSQLQNTQQKPESEKVADDELTSEDKAFINYMKSKILKHLKDDIIPKDYVDFINAIREREAAQTNMFMADGEKTILENMKKDDIPEEYLEVMKEIVGSIILNSKDLQSKFIMRDPSVFTEAYKKSIDIFSKQINNKAKEQVKKVVQTKENVTQVKQPIKEGIGAATTEKKKLSDEEFIEAAFKRLSGNN